MEGASRAVDKMENSIQHIILQEMESLEGIMIATTNLTTNLDKAFERRFLYKIHFDNPTIEARSEIWKTMLLNLEEKDARTLAGAFDLSGGEIGIHIIIDDDAYQFGKSYCLFIFSCLVIK